MPRKGKKKTSNNRESIFNYDKEVKDLTPKQIKKIKKKKQKEAKKRKKQIIKEQKRQQWEENKRGVKLTPQEIRRVKKVERFLKIICLLILIITIIILFLLSPIFNIKKIEVTGNKTISEQEIVSLLGIGQDTNLFKEKTSVITEKLRQNPYIGKIGINRKIPSTLQITIEEREVAYLLEFGESFVYIDSQGYILEISKDNKEDKIKILGYDTQEDNLIPGKRLCDTDLDKLDTIGQILKSAENNEIANLITSIDMSNEEDILLYLDSEQKKVHLGNKMNMDIKMPYIKEIINKEKGNRGEIFVNMDLNTKRPYFRF